MTQQTALVRDWMTPDPVTTTPNTSLLSAYELMEDRAIRRLPVVDDDGRLCGIVTLSDIQQAMPFTSSRSGQHEDVVFALAGQSVSEVMTPDPVTVSPEDVIQRAARQMIARKISGMPVVVEGRPVGIITESDIFRLVVESWPEDDEN